MNQAVKDRLFANSHLMRWIALAAGLFFIVHGTRYQDWVSGLIGGFFLFQAVTNTVASVGNCEIPGSSSQSGDRNAKEVEFTKIHDY